MRRLSLAVCALLVCLGWMPAHAQVLEVYDTFSGDHIDPAKWIAGSICSNAYDCAREVRNGHLRLAVRGYGATSSDTGVTFAQSRLLFANPSAIDTIRFRFNVTSFSSAACPTNPGEAAHPQLIVHGAYFNSGAGANPAEDVLAYFMVERLSNDVSLPATSLRVGAFMSVGTQFFNNVDLGTVEVGEPAVATLKWDPAQKAFVARVVKTITTPSVVEQTMSYAAMSDGAPPVAPFRSVRVGSLAPNCTSERTFTAMDAKFDNLRVNAP